MNEASHSKFVTKKWNFINDQPNTNYDVGNEIIYNTEVLKSNPCDYNDAYILVRGDITIVGENRAEVAFMCISKIDGTTIDEAENLDLVMPMHNLLEYSSNYSDMASSLW